MWLMRTSACIQAGFSVPIAHFTETSAQGCAEPSLYRLPRANACVSLPLQFSDIILKLAMIWEFIPQKSANSINHCICLPHKVCCLLNIEQHTTASAYGILRILYQGEFQETKISARSQMRGSTFLVLSFFSPTLISSFPKNPQFLNSLSIYRGNKKPRGYIASMLACKKPWISLHMLFFFFFCIMFSLVISSQLLTYFIA